MTCLPMRIRRDHLYSAVVAMALLILAGCGGGGGSSSSSGGGGGTGGGVTPTPLPAVDVSAVTAADPGSTLPAGWQRGAFMEIFVRSYQDSNGDGKGDIKGLITRLDYLKDLGISGIWLLPVTQSQDGDHGYAVSDYRNIETAYGNLADLDELLKQAHARGIGVVLDYVMNHSAALNPVFVNSRDATTNTYRDWYEWKAADPGGWSIFGSNPWRAASTGVYFAPFWDQMPDWNLTNPLVVAYHQNNLRFWLNRGVDGFRFDAVGNLVENGPAAWLNQPQNYTLMNDVQKLINGYANRTIVCEAPDDPQGFGASSACGGAFAFDLRSHLANAAWGNDADIQFVANYFKTAPAGMATMVSNHDSFAGDRLWNQVNGDLARYRLAAASYLLLPGTPFIYYGEEVGMANASSITDDGKLRTPMSWTADATNAGFSTVAPYRALSANVTTQNAQTQLTDPNSLRSFYKALLSLRNSRPSIAQGSYVGATVSGKTLSYQRVQGAERSLIVLNYGTAAATPTVTGLTPGARLSVLYSSSGATSTATADSAGNATLPAAALSVGVWAVAP